jgi:hypothetical protein
MADELDALRGKTIRGIIAAAAGQTTDKSARLFFAGLEKILPDTTIRLQNIDGGGGAKGIKELFDADSNVVTIAIFANGPIYSYLLSSDAVPFDLAQLHWIGALSNNQRLLAIRKGLDGTTVETLLKLDRQPIAATSDAGSPSTVESLLLNSITSLRLKIVPGISAGQQLTMVLAGDVDVIIGGETQLAPQIETGDVIPVVRFSRDGYSPALGSLPILSDIVSGGGASDDLVLLLDNLNRIGRLVAAAPSTEPSVVAALRVAFDRTVSDTAYAAAIAAAKLLSVPTSGNEVRNRLSPFLDQSTDFKKTVKDHLECGQKISDGGAVGCE